MSLLSPELGPHDQEMSTQGSTLSDTVIGVKSQPSSESDEEGSYEVDEEDKEEDETPVPEEFENEPSVDEAAGNPSGPASPTITFSVDNKSPTAQFFRQPSDSGGSPSSSQKPAKVPVLRPISPIPGPVIGPPPGINFQPINVVSASSSPTSNASLTTTPPPAEVNPVKASSPRISLQQPVNSARPTSPAMISSGLYPNYPADIQPSGGMHQGPYYPAAGYISTAPSIGPGQPLIYPEAAGSGFLGNATSPYRSPSPIPLNYSQQGVYQPNTMYPPVTSSYGFPVSSTTTPMQMPTPSTVPSVPRNTPVSGFHRPPGDGLDLEELRLALQNDLEPAEHSNRAHINSSGHSTPSQGSHTVGSGFSSQSSSGKGSPYPDRKTSWPATGPRMHNPPYPMNRSVSSPERRYSGERDSPLSRRHELGLFK